METKITELSVQQTRKKTWVARKTYYKFKNGIGVNPVKKVLHIYCILSGKISS